MTLCATSNGKLQWFSQSRRVCQGSTSSSWKPISKKSWSDPQSCLYRQRICLSWGKYFSRSHQRKSKGRPNNRHFGRCTKHRKLSTGTRRSLKCTNKIVGYRRKLPWPQSKSKLPWTTGTVGRHRKSYRNWKNEIQQHHQRLQYHDSQIPKQYHSKYVWLLRKRTFPSGSMNRQGTCCWFYEIGISWQVDETGIKIMYEKSVVSNSENRK